MKITIDISKRTAVMIGVAAAVVALTVVLAVVIDSSSASLPDASEKCFGDQLEAGDNSSFQILSADYPEDETGLECFAEATDMPSETLGTLQRALRTAFEHDNSEGRSSWDDFRVHWSIVDGQLLLNTYQD